MPLTFPSHAVAVVPLHRMAPRVLFPSALVVGTCAPDFGYLLNQPSMIFHSFRGLFVVCLPLGLVAFLLLEAAVLPSFQRTLPTLGPWNFARWSVTRGFPSSLLGWGAVILSLWLGSFSHLLWDGFTHENLEPAKSLYANVRVHVLGHPFSPAAVLQHVSSFAGLVSLLAWMRVHPAPALPADVRPNEHLWLLATPTVLGLAGGTVWHVHQLMGGCGINLHEYWNFIWYSARGGCLGLALGCAAERALTSSSSARLRYD